MQEKPVPNISNTLIVSKICDHMTKPDPKNSEPQVVSAATDWGSNAQMIAYGVYPLGYLHDRMKVYDPTYGLGRFWTLRRPPFLHASDINKDRSPIGYSVDFRYVPFPSEFFDAVVLDPPYKLNGRSSGTGPASSDVDYGVEGYQSIAERHALITEGIVEAVRVLRPSGYLLLKCQDQVSSGRVQWQTMIFTKAAELQNCRLVDMLLLLGGRPQPKGRSQVHARRNYSTLLVLQKGRK